MIDDIKTAVESPEHDVLAPSVMSDACVLTFEEEGGNFVGSEDNGAFVPAHADAADEMRRKAGPPGRGPEAIDNEDGVSYTLDFENESTTSGEHVCPRVSSSVPTDRWSNLDRWDPKMGVFLQSTETTPCRHHLK
jgi:hypothetical protein